ncbi:MTMR1_2 [Lepeophtheirus salmonis]|uniref:phosphatidylinositol-3,5-bisphosphate 3-phosphatase n=1 Tax=Lepeophtheirus salmonis TaxID=72036 RepID=A0A7R8CW67_LEPSM|nr:MTMR1_2 [Lepeophtheirus salmonis]CAF2949404.1 MTMR1_2 [Lepeophtheirus salmonis]
MESDDSSTTSSCPPTMDFPLHGGERMEGVYHEVTYLSPVPMKGSLTVTNYRIYFRSTHTSAQPPLILDVPLGFAARVEKVGGQRTAREGAYGLEIACKDIRSLRFALSKTDPRKDVFETLRRKFNEGRDYRFDDGWRVYDPVSEYRRQGLPNEAWKISRINENYEICDSYPRILGVPSGATDEELREVAKFRSRGRFPVLSWMDPESLATICRCAQPLVGVGGNRNRTDELYVQMIMDANAQSHRIWIMDARPKVNAMANILYGGGYENEDFYDNAELVFLDIHNIHTMRVSLRKVRDVSFPVIDDGRWLSNVDNTHWLDHLSSILSGAVRIAGKVENSKTSVIVHCSDGWDRTSQLTALTMLMLDPYFRSVTGFQVLIEKEWLSFGHKFAHRIGHGEDKPNDNDRSPVFLQFIDCVCRSGYRMMEGSEHHLDSTTT